MTTLATRELIVIDSSVLNYDAVISTLNPEIPTLFLPNNGEGLNALTNALQGFNEISTLHWVTNTTAQSVLCDGEQLDALSIPAQQALLDKLASHLSTNASISLYNSLIDVTPNTALLEQLSHILGVDVTLGNSIVPRINLAGDWGQALTPNAAADSLLPYSVSTPKTVKKAGAVAVTTSSSTTTTTTSNTTTTTTTTTFLTDDYASDMSTTGIVNLGGAVSGKIETINDSDWFRVNLVAGHQYTFELKGVATDSGSLTDPWLVLNNAKGAYIRADNDSGVGTNSLININAKTTGTFYLSANSWSIFDTGSYQLTAKEVSVNHPPVGQVNINNMTPQEGQVLLASGNLTDSDGLGSITYTWKSGITLLGTGKSYQVSSADVGKPLSVTASYTDGLGNAESVSSRPTNLVVSRQGPAVDDYAPDASSNGVITLGGSVTGNIEVANDNDWLRVSLVANHVYTFEMKGLPTNDGSLADPWLQVVNSTGGIMASDNDAGVGTNALVTGFKAPISGNYYLSAWSWSSTATGTYTLTAKESVTTFNNPPTGSVSIDDTTPQQGQTLNASNSLSDLDGLGAITYTWQTGSTSLGTGSSYAVSANDMGKALNVVASYTDSLGNNESVSSAVTSAVTAPNHAPVGTVTISDTTPLRGQVLTASNTLQDADGLGLISYTWQTGSSVLGTGNSYTVTANEVGKAIAVTANYTDLLGNIESVRSSDSSLVATNNLPTGTVSIDDTTPQQGQTLNVIQTLQDSDGLGTLSYVWFAGTTQVGNGASYAVSSSDVGKTISVTASYTDGNGTPESMTSATTAAVIKASAPGFLMSKNDLFTSEDGDTAVISVNLATAPTRDVVINFTGSDATEDSLVNPTLSFTSSNWSTPQSITVVGKNDYLNDGNQPYIVTAAITSSDVNYRQLLIDPIVVTNQEDLTTVSDSRIPIGTVRDMPLKIYGDAIVNTGSVDTATGLYETTGTKPINDILHGLDGNDTIYGSNLQDDLSGGIGNDSLYGENDEDHLYGEDGNDTLFGGEGIDTLEGGAGNDVMDGGAGDLAADVMIGGAGNDTYYLGYGAVDAITDNGLSTDIDTVIMPYQLSSYTLPTGIEKGTISPGTDNSSLSGNTSNNTLTGNDGKNTLNGAVGRDSLFGGQGDDALNGGTDNDVLDGGVGKDVLTGGTGQDTFVFDTALKSNVDKITDFKPVDDTIKLENQIFTKLTTLGVLNASLFVKGTTALDTNDYVIYNPTTGVVTYDSDGSGAGFGVQIAQLGVNLPITSADFIVI